MSRKAAQILVGLLMLLGWGILGVNAIPTTRLDELVNYPNPFDNRNASTVIFYRLPAPARVTIHMGDLFGNNVKEWNFFPGEPGAMEGANKVEWDGTNGQGEKVAAGGYICRVLVEESEGVLHGVRKVGVAR